MDADVDVFEFESMREIPNAVNKQPLNGNVIAPFVPCNLQVALAALNELQSNDGLRDGHTVMDLGCGDGRIIKLLDENYPQVNAIGIEYDELLVKYCNSNWPKLNIIQGDMFICDISGVDYFVLYLLPDGLKRISARFRGCIVVTIGYKIPNLDFYKQLKVAADDYQMGGSIQEEQNIYFYQF